MEETPVWRRGGLVRRGLAFIIDIILVMLLTQSVAALLFSPSNGAIIDSTAFVTDCKAAPAHPADLAIPPGFDRTAGQLCTKLHLGYPTARFYTLSRQEPGSSITTTVSYSVNGQGVSALAFDLAALQLPLLALLRWFLEAHGLTSPGRRLLSLSVEPLRAQADAVTTRAALDRRYMLYALPSAVPILTGAVMLAFQRFGMAAPIDLVVTLAALANMAPAIAATAAFIAIARGRDAYYDAAARTTVVRLVEGAREIAPDQRNEEPVRPGGSVWHRAFRTPLPVASLGLTAVLILVFAAELRAVGQIASGLGVSGTVIVLFGGKSAELVWQVGQWYRLVTANFLHWNIAHLIGNIVPLLIAGWLVEPLIGARWFLAAFLLGGLAGSLASVGFNPPFLISAGASGSVFAVIAVGMVVSLRLGEGPRRLLLQAYGFTILASASTGGMLMAGRVDQADHIGGVLGGVLVGLAILTLWRRTAPHPAFSAVAAAVAVVLSGATVLSIPRSGFGAVSLERLLIPADQLPRNDPEWLARGADLARRYPRDPRGHLALAITAGPDQTVRERELNLVAATQGALNAAEVPRVTQNAFVMVGEARRKVHDYDVARDLFSRAIATSAPPRAAIFDVRALTNLALGRLDEALADREEQIRLQPGAAGPMVLLAGVLSAMGQEQAAAARLDEALAIQPENPFALRQRGWLAFFAARQDQAVADLERSLALQPGDAYTALWLHIVSVRSGRGDRIVAASGKVDLVVWPGAVIRFYRGELDDKALRRAAEQGDVVKRGEQVCEANFYIAQWHLMRDEPQLADPFLRQAVSFCPKTFHEWDLARAERRRVVL